MQYRLCRWKEGYSLVAGRRRMACALTCLIWAGSSGELGANRSRILIWCFSSEKQTKKSYCFGVSGNILLDNYSERLLNNWTEKYPGEDKRFWFGSKRNAFSFSQWNDPFPLPSVRRLEWNISFVSIFSPLLKTIPSSSLLKQGTAPKWKSNFFFVKLWHKISPFPKKQFLPLPPLNPFSPPTCFWLKLLHSNSLLHSDV